MRSQSETNGSSAFRTVVIIISSRCHWCWYVGNSDYTTLRGSQGVVPPVHCSLTLKGCPVQKEMGGGDNVTTIGMCNACKIVSVVGNGGLWRAMSTNSGTLTCCSDWTRQWGSKEEASDGLSELKSPQEDWWNKIQRKREHPFCMSYINCKRAIVSKSASRVYGLNSYFKDSIFCHAPGRKPIPSVGQPNTVT